MRRRRFASEDAHADGEGRFRVGGAPPLAWCPAVVWGRQLLITAPGYLPDVSETTHIDVTTRKPIASGTFALRPAGPGGSASRRGDADPSGGSGQPSGRPQGAGGRAVPSPAAWVTVPESVDRGSHVFRFGLCA